MECLNLPDVRVRVLNGLSLAPQRKCVIYWMTSARRLGWNFALERAAAAAEALGKPLLIVETLACGHPGANRRQHNFALQGMADNARRASGRPVRYYPFVERTPGASVELLAALAENACLIVADDLPIRRFRLETQDLAAVAAARVEAVDSNGLLPLRAADRAYPTAYAFRRFLQKTLPTFLTAAPQPDPLATVELAKPATIPRDIQDRWPALTARDLSAPERLLDSLPIDQTASEAAMCGGTTAAEETLGDFLRRKLPRYLDARNHPDEDATSGLSPYLHYGHISAHEAFTRITAAEKWRPSNVAKQATGQREGWWRLSAPAEAFLDQLIVWRELGYNFCALRDDYDSYESLPDWARKTQAKHARDRRPALYSPQQLETAATGDPVWNAAQRELLQVGRMHNYLRMLWGKKIYEWSPAPQQALATMIELNNKYALDGENPNSYSGIFWALGRYDRPWGPERPIFGVIRYMSSANTARKVRMKRYLERGDEVGGARG